MEQPLYFSFCRFSKCKLFSHSDFLFFCACLHPATVVLHICIIIVYAVSSNPFLDNTSFLKDFEENYKGFHSVFITNSPPPQKCCHL